MSILSRRARVGLVLTAVVALAAVYGLFALKMHNSHEDKCNALTALARDAQKMRYVRQWVAAQTTDRQFMDAVLKYRWFEPGFPVTRQYIDLDWRYLGLDPRSAWVAFNINDAGGDDVDPARIGSVSLNQGRYGIIIKLNAASDLVGKLGPPGDISKIKPVGDDVFVYCDASR